jgi:hypothetical protein
VKIDDLKNRFDMETADVRRDIIKPLSRLNMIERGKYGGFTKTPAFIKVIKQLLDTEHLSTEDKIRVELPDDDAPF